MAKELDLPLPYRLSRKAIPIGGKAAWWYAEPNGDITIYGTSFKGEAFSCQIKARGLKVIRRADDTAKGA